MSIPDSIGTSSPKAFIRPATRSPPKMRSRLSPRDKKKRVDPIALAARPRSWLSTRRVHGVRCRSHAGHRPRATPSSCFTTASYSPFRAWHPQCPDLGPQWGFFSSGGNSFLELDHVEGPVTPLLHQIACQLTQGLIRVVGELAGRGRRCCAWVLQQRHRRTHPPHCAERQRRLVAVFGLTRRGSKPPAASSEPCSRCCHQE